MAATADSAQILLLCTGVWPLVLPGFTAHAVTYQECVFKVLRPWPIYAQRSALIVKVRKWLC